MSVIAGFIHRHCEVQGNNAPSRLELIKEEVALQHYRQDASIRPP